MAVGEYNEPTYGFYSAQADKHCGHMICETVDGEDVKVTSIHRDIDYPDYKWSDIVYVGRVVRYKTLLSRR